MLVKLWGGSARWEADSGVHPHEAAYLRLDCSKAHSKLDWRPLFEVRSALALTVEWYSAFGQKADMRAVTLAQVASALSAASLTVERTPQLRESA
jgi:CDP-glucose 4,6-dehydratase